MRHGRVVLATLVTASGFALPNLADARSGTPTVDRPFPALTRAALNERYAETRRSIAEDARAAQTAGDRTTAERLSALASPGRRFLAYGEHQAVEVIGDLAAARRVAVLVPGADTGPATFDSRGTATPGGGARAVLAEARRIDPRSGLAVIAWLGYEPPKTLSLDVATTRRADRGARSLRRLTGWLNGSPSGTVNASRDGSVNASVHGSRDGGGTATGQVRISLLCHSYGSVVCARAAGRVRVADLAVFGSPGLAVRSARDLHTGAHVWAGRAAGDWMAYVPKVRVLGVGFGADPTSRGFGARPFATGDGGHSDYLEPGGVALRNLALIALGRGAEVTR
ncbi:alpha/beta hydrolase [Actinomadura sp. HBU206391]|uniref:alpha/beta hydrolase n=1 Tax=Actinomadura sp. HBU206391 TaxID=2731692 RepID=UPI00164F9BF3|nr:alpha/beta hydrolase [Actinomadura sp. HBU206391]MBC6457343.1 hypothetical protein [Actinomadura sp. HBU206391]